MVQSRDKGGRGIPNICKESLLLHTFIPFFEASSTIKLTILLILMSVLLFFPSSSNYETSYCSYYSQHAR